MLRRRLIIQRKLSGAYSQLSGEAQALLIISFMAMQVIVSCMQSQQVGSERHRPLVVFNQKFIEGLYSHLDLADPDTVFKTVFFALDSEVVVYPTENYYYFQLYAGGKTIWGNLRLDASDRDQGIIHIGYFEYDENGMYQDREGKEKEFSAKDGVIVERIGSFLYKVSYAGKTVVFRLNDIGKERPQEGQIRRNEVYVGPIFDESGLKFFLLFNKKEKHFMYVLNENENVPEDFVKLSEDVVVGRRTGFGFFLDTRNSRKILIGVNGRSTDRNNYYDGPFDQLPDNYAESTNISKYIEEAYPYTRGNIDKFGGYKNQKGARVVISPYIVYYREEELVDLVETCKNSKLTEDQFYSCITPDPWKIDKEGGKK